MSSSNNGVATVSASGVVTGVSAGTATVTATTQDGGFTATSTITVQIDTSIDFTATATSSSADVNDNVNINLRVIGAESYTATYTNSNTGIFVYNGRNIAPETSFDVFVGNSSGIYNGTAPGTHTLNFTVTSNTGVNASDNTSIEYNGSSTIPVTGVTIGPDPLTMRVGETFTPTFSVIPSNATDQAVFLASSDNTIAAAIATQDITARSVGTVTITATSRDGGFTDTMTVEVLPEATVPLTGVEINPSSLTLNVGESFTFTDITWIPADATNKVANITSNSPSIARMTSGVTVIGERAGTTTIVITTQEGGFTDTVDVTVISNNIPVTGVSVNPNNVSMSESGGGTLIATVSPSNATNQNVTWSSSNTSVATVNSSGVVSGVAPGLVAITVTTQDGGFTATANITVQADNIPVRGVAVSPSSGTITVGNTIRILGSVIPSDATNKNVTWTSSNNSVATVDASGLVTGISPGTANIIITTQDGGWSTDATITVQAATIPVSGVSVSPTSASITEGSTRSLTAAVSPTNATNRNVTWSSSNNGVATVSASGVVTGVSAGTATITATTQDGGFTATSTITVQAAVDNSVVENTWSVPGRTTNAAQIRDKFTFGPNNFQAANGTLTISARITNEVAGQTGEYILIEQLSVSTPTGNAASGPSILGTSATIPNNGDFTIYFDIYADARGAIYRGASTTVELTISNGITNITKTYVIAQDN